MNRKRKTLLFVFGTRPEAIKLAPVIRCLRDDGTFDVKVCLTGQHRELLEPFLAFFDIQPDIDLKLMIPGQSLSHLASKTIAACADAYEHLEPDAVIVQGDTTSAFAASVAASLRQVSVFHVEAGLRSYRRDAPFPEEINRVMISHLAELHFAHTESSSVNLKNEGISKQVFVVGNTVIDALRWTLETLQKRKDVTSVATVDRGNGDRRYILVTLHRRESAGEPLREICRAIRTLAESVEDVEVVFPVHPNPHVRETVFPQLGHLNNVRLIDPLPYPEFILALSKAALVISDSGGVVEEASSLGVPVLIVRQVTERHEAVTCGHARLVGSDHEAIVSGASAALRSSTPRCADRPLAGPFGDGRAAERILAITKNHFACCKEKFP